MSFQVAQFKLSSPDKVPGLDVRVRRAGGRPGRRAAPLIRAAGGRAGEAAAVASATVV
jgi:hypothetical protein